MDTAQSPHFMGAFCLRHAALALILTLLLPASVNLDEL